MNVWTNIVKSTPPSQPKNIPVYEMLDDICNIYRLTLHTNNG